MRYANSRRLIGAVLVVLVAGGACTTEPVQDSGPVVRDEGRVQGQDESVSAAAADDTSSEPVTDVAEPVLDVSALSYNFDLDSDPKLAASFAGSPVVVVGRLAAPSEADLITPQETSVAGGVSVQGSRDIRRVPVEIVEVWRWISAPVNLRTTDGFVSGTVADHRLDVPAGATISIIEEMYYGMDLQVFDTVREKVSSEVLLFLTEPVEISGSWLSAVNFAYAVVDGTAYSFDGRYSIDAGEFRALFDAESARLEEEFSRAGLVVETADTLPDGVVLESEPEGLADD